jgi:hypothetical protein
VGWYNEPSEAMKDSFFEVSHPRHMLEKAKRDFDRMISDLNTDTIFNFFVTTYHVRDYVEVQSEALRAAIKERFEKAPDFRMCDYICHKGKHLELKAKRWKDYPFKTQHNLGALFDGAPFDEVCFDANEGYCLVVDGEEIDVIALGRRVLEKWERFFKDNGI